MSERKSGPALASLVRQGDAQTEAVAITPFIFMARDISNAYLATPKAGSADGDLMVSAGFMDNADPIIGADKISSEFDRMHGAVSFVRDFTLDGINAGKTMLELMRTIALPEHLKIGEFHGKVSWSVCTSWDEYSGRFCYEDGITELFSVPRRETCRAGGIAHSQRRRQLDRDDLPPCGDCCRSGGTGAPRDRLSVSCWRTVADPLRPCLP